MEWITPSVIATLASSLLLAAVFFFLHSQYKENFMRTWAWSWVLYSTRFVFTLAMLHANKSAAFAAGEQLAGVVSSLLLIWGAYQFNHKQLPLVWTACAAAAGAWAVAVSFSLSPTLVLSLPPFMFQGVAYICTGTLVIKGGGRTSGARLTGWLFIVWGAHKLDYPFMRSLEWFAPWGFLLSAVLAVAVAMGVLIIYFQRVSRFLEQSEKTLRSIMDNATAVIFIKDLDGRYMFINEAFEQNHGVSKNNVRDLTDHDIFPPHVADAFQANDFEVLRWGGPMEFEETVPHEDGVRTVISVKFPLFDVQGQPYAVCGMSTDITGRKQAEDALRESENKMRSIFRAAPIGIGVTANRVLLDVNETLCAITGYSAGELVGQSARILYPSDEDFEFVGREKYRQIAEKGTGTVETRFVRKDGRMIDVLLSSTPIVPDDLSAGVTFTALDITDRKRAERDKDALQQQLLQSQKMDAIGHLAGGVAHDFNNMLGVIIGYTQLALADMPAGSEARDDLEQVLDAAMRSKDLTMKLLTFARKERIKTARVSADALIGGVAAILQRSLLKNVTVTTRAEPGIEVAVDENQIRQALMNVCVNARDAMPGGGELILEARAVSEPGRACPVCAQAIQGDYCLIRIRDTGIGIPPDILARVYDPFFTTKGAGQGTGLGLSTTLGIVQNHGGHISISSEPGSGTVVDILLPLRELDTEREEKPEAEPQALSGSETILVVDDEQAMCAVAARILSDMGYTPITATSGPGAVEIFSRQWRDIDLVILDIIMPGMDGPQTLAELKKINPAVKAVAASGYSQNGQASDIMDLGAAAFIQKPFLIRDLCQAVRRVLDAPA